MQITADQVKQLRDKTGAGMMECKKALAEAGGDTEKAVDILRKSGIAKAEKRGERSASEGRVDSYIHPGNRVGVLVEVNCETDFVGRNEEFAQLVRELAMQVAAAGADYVRREEVPAERVAKEKEIFSAQLANEGKPANIIEKILVGKVDKFYSEVCLLEQPFVMNPDQSVGQLLAARGKELAGDVVVAGFVRFRLGEAPDA
jgi:elongation factor Ts